ncbi:triose-phosphate isomerase [Candidatus Falkowbacteria bacterium]|nr:triose-phosphate isomerase [Candidatus Falkowbacteria bacterium]
MESVKSSKNKIVIANWKMKLSLKESIDLANDLKNYCKVFKKGSVVVCPNFMSIIEVKKILKDTPIVIGSQDVFWEQQGAYTGEVSPSMVLEAGCEYAIIGHSERRKYMLENYEMIHQKLKAVLNTDGITPIVCIGENEDERKTDRRDFVLVHQLQQSLGGISLLENQQVIIAYEPIWAIGSGIAIEPEEAVYAHKIIKLTLNDMFGPQVSSNNFKIIYGGSISSKIVKDFVDLENIDGLLVGGASLNAEEFCKVAKAMLASSKK